MPRILPLLTILLTLLITPAFSGTAKPVIVFAGSASQPPLEEAAKAFAEKSGIPITLHLGGSGAKHRKIGSRDNIYYQPESLDVANFLRNQNIYDTTVAAIASDGSLQMENSITGAPSYQGAQIGDRVAVGIRSEEIVIIRANKPIGPELQQNLFDGIVTDILAFGGTHTLIVKVANTGTCVDIELPNCAMRDLGYTIGDELQICLRRHSLWTIKKEIDDVAV